MLNSTRYSLHSEYRAAACYNPLLLRRLRRLLRRHNAPPLPTRERGAFVCLLLGGQLSARLFVAVPRSAQRVNIAGLQSQRDGSYQHLTRCSEIVLQR